MLFITKKYCQQNDFYGPAHERIIDSVKLGVRISIAPDEQPSHCTRAYLYPISLMFAETAAKHTDVVDLIWKQVDLEKKQVKLLRTDKCQEGTLPMSEELTSVLEKKKKTFGPVFQTYYKEPFTKNKLSTMVNEFKVKGKCEIKWTPMDLRHSFAVNFLSKGGDVRRLQYILGHGNVYDTKKM